MRDLSVWTFVSLVSGSLAGLSDRLLWEGCYSNSCARAVVGVTGTAGLSTRSADCAAFLAGHSPIPSYAASCSEAQYSSACSSCLGAAAASAAVVVVGTPIPAGHAPSTPFAAEAVVDPNPSGAPTPTVTRSTTITEMVTTSIAVTKTMTLITTVYETRVPDATNTWTGLAASAATWASASGSVSTCLSDAQATAIVNGFKFILTSANRTAANATAETLIATEYMETSDSINSLAGLPLGNATFPSKSAFQSAVINQPPIPILTTLDAFHDCRRIAWYWSATGVGSGIDDVRGVNLFYVTEDLTQISMTMSEFNSVAWAADTGHVLCVGGCGE